MASRLEDLIREHAERLEQLAGPIELNDVTSGARNVTATVTLIDAEAAAASPESRRWWPIVAVAAAVAAIVVGGLILTRGDDDPTVVVPTGEPTTDVATTAAPLTDETAQSADRRAIVDAALRGVGFVGLPPVDAQPSLPARGSRVLSISPCPSGPIFDGLSLYDDGRLIWAVSGRMVEQRLTSEGVELIRTELRNTGLLGDLMDGECVPGWYRGFAGDDIFVAPVDAQILRLADPASWLPASAWEDREISAFVPSEYSIFMSVGSSVTQDAGTGPRMRLDLAALLPAAARDVLLTTGDELLGTRWETQGDGYTTTTYAGLTTDQTRTLVEALDGAGFEARVDDENNGAHLEYLPSDEYPWHIEFFPRQPHQVGGDPIPGTE